MLKFEVLAPNSEWVAEGERYSANENPRWMEEGISEPSEALVKLAGSAHAAGVIDVTEGLDDSHVQSQEDGEEALAEAMGEFIPPETHEDGTVEPGRWSGPWHEGNLESASLDATARATMGVEVDAANVEGVEVDAANVEGSEGA